jgi:hypothetical protein
MNIYQNKLNDRRAHSTTSQIIFENETLHTEGLQQYGKDTITTYEGYCQVGIRTRAFTFVISNLKI